MRKKTNMIKRNSGFIVGCVLTAGASFFAADVLMSEVLPEMGAAVTIVPESNGVTSLEAEAVTSRTFETDPFTVTAAGNIIKGVETETPKKETEEQQTDEEGNPIQTETDENGNPIQTETDENGNPVDSSAADGSGETSTDGSGSGESSTDGSSDGDGSYGGDDSSYNSSGSGYSDTSYNEPIEIYDQNNGEYYYDNSSSGSYSDSSYDDGSYSDGSGSSGSSSGSGGSGSSSSNSGAWTPDDVIISGISSRYIDVSELYSYGPSTLRLIRNEIFALHGRIFNSQDLRDYFSQKSWYVPTYNPEDFDANMFDYLNDYEEANLKLILEYEDWLATQ